MFLSERIKSIAPANASYYRLMVQFHDGNTRIFPIEAGSFFNVGDSPYGVPTGNYTLCFYDNQCRPMPHYDQALQVNLQNEVHRASQSQLSLHLSPRGAESSAQSAGQQVALPGNTNGIGQQPVLHTSKSNDAIASSEGFDSDYQKHLQAMDLEERQQDFIKNSAYVTEVGEIFTLNRIMRRELMELQRVVVVSTQQIYKDAEHVKGTIHDLLQLQKDVLASAAKQIAQPPPPPPDYVGLGHSALALVREIGVAFIQRSQAQASGRQIFVSDTPQLASHLASEPAKRSQADIIERMISKLKSTTDLDMAISLSSPTNWKAMLDDLVQKNGAENLASKEPSNAASEQNQASPGKNNDELL